MHSARSLISFALLVTDAIAYRPRMTAAIIKQIESLGYIVKSFRVNGTTELHAVPVGESEPQIARCNHGNGPDEEYRAACMLAKAVGIDLED